jgi:hypothetical protein
LNYPTGLTDYSQRIVFLAPHKFGTVDEFVLVLALTGYFNLLNEPAPSCDAGTVMIKCERLMILDKLQMSESSPCIKL